MTIPKEIQIDSDDRKVEAEDTQRDFDEKEEVKVEDSEKHGSEVSSSFKKVLYSAGPGKSIGRKINTTFKNGQIRF